jgi:hypothetical protein
MENINCIVLAITPDGERDLMGVRVRCSEGSYDNGNHYYEAELYFERQGYCVLGVFDDTDIGGRNIADKFDWDSMPLID